MTTITKERLLTIKQWRETYGPGSNVVLPAEEAEELARIALASLEAKPIGAFHIAEQQVDGTSDYLKDGEWPIDNGIIEVYAAPPPVPVVPEEKPMPNPLSMYAVDAVAAIAEVRGWNACRAAMLQSGNFRENKNSSTNNFREIAETSTCSPVIPAGWISCSERMPDDGQWCVVEAADGYYVQCWSEGQGWIGDDISLRNCDVIRWMSIPEPPQQEADNG